jgi:DNA repair exonuclease SbcCD nuclease subunit
MDDPESERSSLITPQEIAASGFDYLALGHVHAHRRMHHGDTVACYPGVPAAHLGTRETGTMAIIDLVPGQPATISEHPVHGKPRKHESRLHSQTA